MHSIAVLEPPATGPLFVTAEDDQVEEWLRRAKEEDERRVQKQLIEVADHLDAVNPAGPMTDSARFFIAVMVAGDTADKLRPLLPALPFTDALPKGATRGDYARHIRAQAAPDGDLPPSPIHIPRIPPQPRPNNTVAVAA